MQSLKQLGISQGRTHRSLEKHKLPLSEMLFFYFQQEYTRQKSNRCRFPCLHIPALEKLPRTICCRHMSRKNIKLQKRKYALDLKNPKPGKMFRNSQFFLEIITLISGAILLYIVLRIRAASRNCQISVLGPINYHLAGEAMLGLRVPVVTGHRKYGSRTRQLREEDGDIDKLSLLPAFFPSREMPLVELRNHTLLQHWCCAIPCLLITQPLFYRLIC